jgi:site-specific recombinase XerD
VTLPWRSLDGEPVTARLVLTNRERNAMNRNYFNTRIWHRALAAAGLPDGRQNGMHALRHFYASVLLDAG